MARGDIDVALLAGLLEREWGLTFDSLERVPYGWAAACYVGGRGGEPAAFVKVWPAVQVPRLATLELTVRLAAALTTARVPAPLPTRHGSLTASLGSDVVGVYPFVAGRHLGDWADPECARLPVALAELHGHASALRDLDLEADDFALDCVELLRTSMRLAEARRNQDAPRAALARFFDLHRAALDAASARLEDLERGSRASACELVVAHSDSGGNNCLVDGDGALWLLDWDDAVIGRPEEDLKTGAQLRVLGHHDPAAFLRIYCEAPGARPLHRDHLTFFVLRRPVEDIAEDARRILNDEEPDPEARLRSLATAEWGVPRLGVVDAIVDGVGAYLDA